MTGTERDGLKNKNYLY